MTGSSLVLACPLRTSRLLVGSLIAGFPCESSGPTARRRSPYETPVSAPGFWIFTAYGSHPLVVVALQCVLSGD